MDGVIDTLPSLKIPCNPGVNRDTVHAYQMMRNGSVSLPATPDLIRTPSVNTKIPQGSFRRVTNRTNGYSHRNTAYGSKDVVKKIFTGKLPGAYFNDICYGRRATPSEFMYRTPTQEREKELWEPKNVSREKARHVVRDIQDARFRKQALLEKRSVKKEREGRRKTEAALLRESEMMSRGLQVCLANLDKQKQNYLSKSKSKASPKPLEHTYHNDDVY